MQELSRHLNDRNSVPPMVNAAMAHLNLVMVHPFKDGNGRMARVLQSLVLAVAGVQTAPEFCSIEEYLGRNTGAYYDILEMVRQGSWHPANDALAWVRFNLVAHYRQAITVLRRARQAERLYVLAEREVGRARLLERMTDPMFHSLSGLRLNNSVYRDLAGVNDATASRDLKALVDARLLVPIGEKRGRSYVPVNRLVEVHAEVRATLPAELSADIDPYKEEGRAEQLVLA